MVPYGKLVDDFRGSVSSASKDSMALSLLKNISHSSQLSAIAGSLLNLYQASGLQKTGIARLVKLEQINRLLPAGSRKKTFLEQQNYPAINLVKGEVGLFQGCMGNLLDQATVIAAIRVLNQAGFNVYLPNRQTCCGALDLHSGETATAEKLAKKNIDAFSERQLDAIITIASGCGATLQEYEDRKFSGKIMDISQFLCQADTLDKSRFSVLDAKVIVHTPCSLRNVMQADESAIQIVKQIPGIEIITIPESIQCCGSAGSYMLEHPEMANALLDDLLREVTKQLPKYLVTSNIGCALHITAGLKNKGIDLEVIHPIVMIDRVYHANVMNEDQC